MSTATKSYESLVSELRDISVLGSVHSILDWDEKTNMPAKAAMHRAKQSAMLAKLVHQRFTSPQIGEWLGALESSDLVASPDSDAAVNVRETRREYDRATKLPESLVVERAELRVMAQQAWKEARQNADFPAFAPWLDKTIALVRKEAECFGYKDHPYDALLEGYEPHESTARVRAVFSELRPPLVELVRRVVETGRKAPVEILHRKFPRQAQEKFAREVQAAVGFDFQAGRLDVSAHPFCTTLGPCDVRLTTRYNEQEFSGAFFGVLHETGHGLYEQGVLAEHWGTPRGSAVSLGIHESQSRLWENLVGRSRAFWRHFLPQAKIAFAESLGDVSEDAWYKAINDIRPSLIRVEADEATYNLHILLRFELEQSMVAGELAAADVPAAWNQKMRDYLGLTPPDPAKGVLQDIHWSIGAIGYFSTYTLGNLYAAQFFEQARKDLPDLDAMFARGELAPLREWLRKNIHSQGQRFTAKQLVKHVTGRELTVGPLMEHLRKKAAEVYGL